jgi:hypothetical protein
MQNLLQNTSFRQMRTVAQAWQEASPRTCKERSSMRISLLVLALVALCTPAFAQAPASFRVSSPEGVLSVDVTTDNDGRPTYAVSRLGRPVVAPSRLGFILTDAAKLERAS